MVRRIAVSREATFPSWSPRACAAASRTAACRPAGQACSSRASAGRQARSQPRYGARGDRPAGKRGHRRPAARLGTFLLPSAGLKNHMNMNFGVLTHVIESAGQRPGSINVEVQQGSGSARAPRSAGPAPALGGHHPSPHPDSRRHASGRRHRRRAHRAAQRGGHHPQGDDRSGLRDQVGVPGTRQSWPDHPPRYC